MKYKNTSKLVSGLSLAEILIALGILALITSLLLSTFVSFRKEQALDKDTELIVEILEQARSETLSSKNASQYGVHFASGQITIFTGGVYSPSDSTNQDFILNATDTIITITLTGGGSDVVFNRLTGESNQYGTVVVSSPTTGRIRTVTIYKTGVIEST
jgi:Tfp pilus assembly protein FimT